MSNHRLVARPPKQSADVHLVIRKAAKADVCVGANMDLKVGCQFHPPHMHLQAHPASALLINRAGATPGRVNHSLADPYRDSAADVQNSADANEPFCQRTVEVIP